MNARTQMMQKIRYKKGGFFLASSHRFCRIRILLDSPDPMSLEIDELTLESGDTTVEEDVEMADHVFFESDLSDEELNNQSTETTDAVEELLPGVIDVASDDEDTVELPEAVEA